MLFLFASNSLEDISMTNSSIAEILAAKQIIYITTSDLAKLSVNGNANSINPVILLLYV